MGNSKSSMAIVHKSFDDFYIDSDWKQNDCSIYTKSFDDYYQSHGGAGSEQKLSELKRGRSLFYSKSKINGCNQQQQQQQSSTTSSSSSLSTAQNFKRINSLPPISRLQRKQQQQQQRQQQQQSTINSNQNELIEPKQLHKGFDMIRHHFGQKDCEWTPKLTELETSILLLNEKVTELELSRQDCLRKLSRLKIELEQQQQLQQQQQQQKNSRKILQLPMTNNKSNHHHQMGHVLRINFIENYMKRLENLLHIDREPFLAITTCSSSSSSIDNHHSNDNQIDRFCDKIQPNQSTAKLTTEMKCKQIKNYYEYLLKTVMPQLYGNQNSFKHKSDKNYCQFRQTLIQLRYQVQIISTQSEQQLLDAKRAFIQEIDSYIKTLDNMIVNDFDDCQQCYDYQ
uniref:Uncharacterized protein n=1 Tax=Dermatophagoides pteronyssinus TaxID=6956 RepID=A0A6P6YI64_DERPT|nr:putative uncharacterized protein DDB_G0271606 [Dermatophagoides pteronyssinus]